MESKDIAVKIYRIARASKGDFGLAVISAVEVLKDADTTEVLEYYNKLLKKELEIAKVTTAKTLKSEEKTKCEHLVKQRFGENLLFEYNVDERVVGGILVEVGDKVLDDTLRRKILETN